MGYNNNVTTPIKLWWLKLLDFEILSVFSFPGKNENYIFL